MIKTTIISDPPRKEISQITADDTGELFLWTNDNRQYNPCLLTYQSFVSLSKPSATWGYSIDNSLNTGVN